MSVVSLMMATLKKELREVLRDKRTLFLTVLFPLIFYPALLLLAGGLGAQQQQETAQRPVRIGLSGVGIFEMADSLNDTASQLKWLPMGDSAPELQTKLENNEIDLFVILRSETINGFGTQHADIHYFSTVQGESSCLRVEGALDRYKLAKIRTHMGDVLSIAKVDHASARLSAGSKFGGIGAYFLVFLAFTGCMAVAVDAAAGEKERGTLEAMLATAGPFTGIALGKLLFIVAMGLLSVISTAGGIGMMMLWAAKTGASMNIGGIGFSELLGMLFLLLTLVFFFATLLFSVSITARSSREAHIRSSMVLLLVAMSLVYCTLPGVALTKAALMTPVLNIAMALKGLLEGTLSLTEFLTVAAITLTLSAMILAWISRKVRNNPEKVLL